MTDLELTRLCAEAMGFVVLGMVDGASKLTAHCPYVVGVRVAEGKKAPRWYSPLHDDAQCFALVKKFDANISRQEWSDGMNWYVECQGEMGAHKDNLNRAIVECVAKLMEAKRG